MLAIVIPYFKIHFFESTLASLAVQANKNFALYIGNDASPEDPEEIIEKYRDKLHIKYHRYNHNLGSNSLVKQWDRCIEMTDGEDWIMILGDDDVLEENVVSCFYSHLNEFRSQATVVRFSTRIITERPYHISDAFKHPVWEPATSAHFRRVIGETRSSLSEYIFRREAYDKHGFFNFPLAWHADDRAWLEFSGKRLIYSINEACVYIRNSHINISGRSDNEGQKYEASRAFYRYILSKQLYKYQKYQRSKLIEVYRNLLKRNRTLRLREKLHIFSLHLRYSGWRILKKEARKLLR